MVHRLLFTEWIWLMATPNSSSSFTERANGSRCMDTVEGAWPMPSQETAT
jgi:hypothetical protein